MESPLFLLFTSMLAYLPYVAGATAALFVLFVVGWIMFWNMFDFRTPVKMEYVSQDKLDAAKKVEATEEKFLIIGAGFCGLGCAAALKRNAIAYDAVERSQGLGGNWLNGVYNDVHIISSKDWTEYKDYPMPATYPEFPSSDQMLAYLKDYARHWGIEKDITYHTEVLKVEKNNEGEGYIVTMASCPGGDQSKRTVTTKLYKGIVASIGHHWNCRMPVFKGKFNGEIMHSKEYKSPDQLRGKRVLTIGAGNSACDVCVSAARVGKASHISLRRGHWFMPRTFWGRTIYDLEPPFMPKFIVKLFMRFAIWVTIGDYRRYGLPLPDHNLFDLHPTINDDILRDIKKGKVKVHGGIDRLDGDTVHFNDGTSIDVDMIVCATGFQLTFPIIDVTNGGPLTYCSDPRSGYTVPNLIENTAIPGCKNFFVAGVVQAAGGVGPLVTMGADVLTKIAMIQDQFQWSILDILVRMGFCEIQTRLSSKVSADILMDPYTMTMRYKFAMWLARVLPRIKPLVTYIMTRPCQSGAEAAVQAARAKLGVKGFKAVKAA